MNNEEVENIGNRKNSMNQGQGQDNRRVEEEKAKKASSQVKKEGQSAKNEDDEDTEKVVYEKTPII